MHRPTWRSSGLLQFLHVLRFEVGVHLRRPSTWVFLAAMLAVAFWVSASVAEGARRSGDALVNAPLTVTLASVMVSIVGLLVTAALFGDAAARDVQTRMDPLVATAPVGRSALRGGRFAGALVVNAALLLAAAVGLALAAQDAVVGADLLGPFRPSAYGRAYAFVLLPNLFVTGAVAFACATVTRRALAAYGGGLLLFVAGGVSEEVLAEGLGRPTLGALLDPFGFAVLSGLQGSWTPAEQNVQAVGLEGLLLWNRLLWLALGLAVLAVALRVRRRPAGVGRRRGRATPADVPDRRPAAVAVPPVPRAFGAATWVRQALGVASFSSRRVVTGRGFWAAALGVALVVLTLGAGALADNFGTPYWPTTGLVTGLLRGFLVDAGVAVLTLLFAGEVVWGERDARVAEVVDAAPVLDGAVFVGRLLGFGLVLVALHAVLGGAGLLLQAVRGPVPPELALFGQALWLGLVDALLFAALALTVHVVVDDKAVGHLVGALLFAATAFAGRVGVEHDLLVYGSAPPPPYSDLAGFGPFLEPWFWPTLYWSGWAVLLAVAASLFWVRGRGAGAARRLRQARGRLTRGTTAVAAAGAAVVVGAGGVTAAHTHVLNEDRTDDDEAALRAQYERRYGRYDGVPQPQVTGTWLHVELYPERRVAEVRGTYRLENPTGVAVDTVHLSVAPDVETGPVTFSRPARAVLVDDRLGHRAYVLERPLAPGDTLRMTMTYGVRFRPRGFSARGPNPSVVGNGTYFDHTGGRRPNGRRWLPVVGYQPDRELADASVRRAHGLLPRPDARPLGDAAARRDPAGRERTTFEAVVGTAGDQVAVAPGRLRETWMEGDRRYVRYATDGPVKNAYAVFSARYAVREARWAPAAGPAVRIEVYHHPGHSYNVERMVRAVRASLDYYTRHFGPYPHRELRIVEFPRYGAFAYAYPGTIAYGEGFGFLSRVDEAEHLDTPFMVVAHEVAHQWWGYGLAPADVEGAPVLTEVLAQYSALAVLEEAYGPDMARRFLDVVRIEYLNRRTGREAPLLRAGEDANVVYRRGALAMHAVQGYVGRERVNAALRRLLREHGGGRPPYPTSLDLYRELRAVTPDSLRPLLADLLEERTVWGLRTVGARAEPTGRGAWRVAIDVVAQKHRPDGAGTDVEVPMDDPVEVGVYTDEGDPLYLQRHRLRSGRQTITVIVPRRPARAGVDPRHLLIDRDLGENSVRVRARPAARPPNAASPTAPR